ncbi:hypothetical protein [Nonomuraea sp. B12E4]|uniref:hypothetical protein n=1 Tax=Nonomuraea sp. B12E4 TaxID=3153564 RepID=UPI00325FA9A6
MEKANPTIEAPWVSVYWRSILLGRRGGELPLEQRLGRARQPFDLLGRGRISPFLPAAGQQRGTQPLPRRLHWADLVGQPERQLVLVGDRRLTKAVKPADLRPVIFDRAARPAVLGEQRRIDLHLARHVVDRGLRHVLPAREAALKLEVLQHQAEPETGGAALVRQQFGLGLIQCPALDEVLQLPLSAHRQGSLLPRSL